MAQLLLPSTYFCFFCLFLPLLLRPAFFSQPFRFTFYLNLPFGITLFFYLPFYPFLNLMFRLSPYEFFLQHYRCDVRPCACCGWRVCNSTIPAGGPTFLMWRCIDGRLPQTCCIPQTLARRAAEIARARLRGRRPVERTRAALRPRPGARPCSPRAPCRASCRVCRLVEALVGNILRGGPACGGEHSTGRPWPAAAQP